MGNNYQIIFPSHLVESGRHQRQPLAFSPSLVDSLLSPGTFVQGSDAEKLIIQAFYSGAVVQRQAIPAGEHTVEVSVSKLRPGGYHYALEVDGRPVAHHNLLVQ